LPRAVACGLRELNFVWVGEWLIWGRSMNMFRLVLCLAGLTIYLVVRQFLHPQPALAPPGATPAGKLNPEAQQAVPKTPRPQTQPHIEVLKPDTSYAEAR